MSVFAIESVSTTASRSVARLRLDPGLPYLADHRPGGDPLFGTVAGIEALSTCALHTMTGLRVQAIESLKNHAPFILTAGVEPVIEVSWERELGRLPAHNGVAVSCSMTSAGTAEARHTHLHARLRLAANFEEPPRDKRFEAPSRPLPVGAEDIYGLFFHGPALRVVGGACWEGGRLYARSARELPACFAAPGVTVASPRLIELALQSAGLFEIAANQRMMIPHAIGRIERFSELEIDCGRTFWAVAAPSTSGPTSHDLDIDVFDEDGQLHLRVSAYQTLPLPFVLDSAGPATLQRHFL